ncbi:MAG TPA: TIR domain-containing protein [Allosphingosinicella sp.]|nr:TIR domain-containing protein [Allosphingosinicella sp.]
MSGHVFISHASENRDEANELVALLESKGVTAWIAPRDVRPGLDYSEELQRAIENAAAFVVLVTDHSNKSPYVRAETEMAFSCQKPMLPMRLTDINPAPGLAFFLKIRHWTDAYGANREAALSRLVLELQTLTGKAPSWAPKVGAAAPPPLAETPRPPPPVPVPPPPPPSPPPPPTPGSPPPLSVAPAPPVGTGRRIPPWAIGVGALVLIAIVVAVVLLSRRGNTPPSPFPPNNGAVPAPTPGPGPTPTPAPTPSRAFANELTDYGVMPKNELEANVGSPTPMSIPVGNRVTTDEVHRLANEGNALLVDVLAGDHPQSLPNALYMPAGGLPGTFEDVNQVQFGLQLLQATGGDQTRPLVFFCQGANCWESYNAMLRASALGYSQLYWYRGGLAAWQEAGFPMGPLPGIYGNSNNNQPNY